MDERIEDNQALVNMDLDQRRNELVALNLVVVVLTLGLTIITMVAGVFGMNLRSGIEDSQVNEQIMYVQKCT